MGVWVELLYFDDYYLENIFTLRSRTTTTLVNRGCVAMIKKQRSHCLYKFSFSDWCTVCLSVSVCVCLCMCVWRVRSLWRQSEFLSCRLDCLFTHVFSILDRC